MHHVGQEGLHRIVVRVEVDVGQICDGAREGVRAGSREHDTGSVGEFLAIGEDPRTFFEKALPGVVVLELRGIFPVAMTCCPILLRSRASAKLCAYRRWKYGGLRSICGKSAAYAEALSVPETSASRQAK